MGARAPCSLELALLPRCLLSREACEALDDLREEFAQVLEGQGQQLHLRGGAQLKLQAGGWLPRCKGCNVAEHLAGREAAQDESARAALPALGRVTVVPALVALAALEDAPRHGVGAGHGGELRAAREEKGEHPLQRRADEGLCRRGGAAALQVKEAAGGDGVVLDEVGERGELRCDEAAQHGHLPQLRHHVRRLRRAGEGCALNHHHTRARPTPPHRPGSSHQTSATTTRPRLLPRPAVTIGQRATLRSGTDEKRWLKSSPSKTSR